MRTDKASARLSIAPGEREGQVLRLRSRNFVPDFPQNSWIGAFSLSELHEFLGLWRDLYRIERKVIAADFGVSAAQYWRIETGRSPLSVERLRALGRLSDASVNTLLLAFMLMDDNVCRISSNDPGDRLVHWLHKRLASEARRNETDSAARHFLGRPQSLEDLLDELTRESETVKAAPEGLEQLPVTASG